MMQAILVGLVGVVAVIDSRLIGRQNLSRSLILATLTGLVLGDLTTGVVVGASLELMSMGFVAIGAAAPPNMMFGSIIATSFVILTGSSVEAALTLAIPVAMLGNFQDVLMRMAMSRLGHRADKNIADGEYKAARRNHILWAVLLNSILYFVPIFLSVYLGTDLVQSVVNAIPEALTQGLNVAGSLLSALGFAMLLNTMLTRDLFVYFLFGFLIVSYLAVDLIGVTMFAVIISIIIDQITQQKEVVD